MQVDTLHKNGKHTWTAEYLHMHLVMCPERVTALQAETIMLSKIRNTNFPLVLPYLSFMENTKTMMKYVGALDAKIGTMLVDRRIKDIVKDTLARQYLRMGRERPMWELYGLPGGVQTTVCFAFCSKAKEKNERRERIWAYCISMAWSYKALYLSKWNKW